MTEKKPRKKKAAPAPTAPVVADPTPAPEPEVVAAPPVADVVEEQRVETPEAEAITLSIAEEIGVLPEADRRAPEPIVESGFISRPGFTLIDTPEPEAPAPPAANDDLHVVRQRADGKKVTAHGSILE